MDCWKSTIENIMTKLDTRFVASTWAPQHLMKQQLNNVDIWAVIPLTENKKSAKYTNYNSSRPIVFDPTFLYADNVCQSTLARGIQQ